MSRIGKAPVYLDEKTQASVGAGNVLTLKGAKSSLNIPVAADIKIEVEGKKSF